MGDAAEPDDGRLRGFVPREYTADLVNPPAGRARTGSRGRRAARASLVAVVAVAGALVWSPPATADTLSVDLVKDNQAWFWSSNKEIRQCVGTEDRGACQVADLSGAAPVEPGHIAVALLNGGSDMRSYLFFDLSAVPAGSDVSSFEVRLNVSRTDATDAEHTANHTGTGAKTPATSSEEKASITACAVTVPWGPVEAAPPYSMDKKDPTKTHPVEPFVKNGYNCGLFGVKGKAGNPWVFDLTAIARRWVAGTVKNNGIVLLPDVTSGTDSWRVEFHAAKYDVQNNETRQVYVSAKHAGSARIVFTPPVAPPPPPPDPIVIPGEPVTDPLPAPAPAPTSVADPQPAPPPAVEPVASREPDSALYIWLVVPFGLAAFAALSRAVGREAGAATANRVAEVLRRRRQERLEE